MPETVSINVVSKGTNLIIAIFCGLVFATCVTNCIVYAKGTTSSQQNSNTPPAVTPACSTIMLIVNVAISIVSFLGMIYCFYRVFTSVEQRSEHAGRVKRIYNSVKPKSSKYNLPRNEEAEDDDSE